MTTFELLKKVKNGLLNPKTAFRVVASRFLSSRNQSDFVLTGIPRSGTSLACKILDQQDNWVCSNEVHYSVRTLPLFFRNMRSKLKKGEPIPNKFDRSGNVVTDTQEGQEKLEPTQRSIDIRNDDKIVLTSKVNIPYLEKLEQIFGYGYKVLVLIRNPIFTLGSWSSEKAQNIPEAHVIRGEMHPRWEKFNFLSENQYERQAQIWNHYASLVWTYRSKVQIVKYENLCQDTDKTLKKIEKFLDLNLDGSQLPKLRSYNKEDRYNNLKDIKNAVTRYCPSRKHFGYS